MGNLFSTKPVLDTTFPKVPTLWTCPVTGLQVPKDPDANMFWRADLVEAAELDVELQQDLYTACSKSLLFFVNAFVFTLRIFEPGKTGEVVQSQNKHLPFVTWAIQDRHLLRLELGIDKGKSLLTDKSRDMGATWDHIAVYVHRLLFRPDESHLMLSRKEETVDKLDGQPKNYPFGSLADPGTLFGKIDYILSRLPEWMLPRLHRKAMHIVNLDTRTRIDGESSNATAGSSDRRHSIFLDEMAKMKEGESIKRSTADVTACRFPCSTPNGAGTAYSKWRQSETIEVFELAWWEHPEKGAGRYVEVDKLGRYRIRSPWYDVEALARTPKELAIEIDMDHVGSGDLFFENNIIEQHRLTFAKEPRRTLDIGWNPALSDIDIRKAVARNSRRDLVIKKGGPLRIWSNLIGGRLDQSFSYTLGVDISKGQGASNSVIAIVCDQTKEQVGEWADANTVPHEFAKACVGVALWVGGKNRRPLIIFENNGDPGHDFGRQLIHTYRYPNFYYDRVAGTTSEKKGKRYGWRSTPEKKATALGDLRRLFSRGLVIVHSKECLNEALTYVYYEGGGIGPAALMTESVSARKTHGDRIIATMLAYLGSAEAPTFRRIVAEVSPRTFAGRFKRFVQQKKSKNNKNRFNFKDD